MNNTRANLCQCDTLSHKCDYCRIKKDLSTAYWIYGKEGANNKSLMRRIIRKEDELFALANHYYNHEKLAMIRDFLNETVVTTVTNEAQNMSAQCDSFEVINNKIFIKDRRDVKILCIDLANNCVIFLTKDNKYLKNSTLSKVSLLELEKAYDNYRQIIRIAREETNVSIS